MARPWVKLWTSILHDVDFLALSSEARHTFYACIAFAGALDCDGELRGRNIKAGVVAIGVFTGYDTPTQSRALQELCDSGFMRNTDGVWSVVNFSKHQPAMDDATRAKNYRDRKRDAENQLSLSRPDASGQTNGKPAAQSVATRGKRSPGGALRAVGDILPEIKRGQ